MPINKHSRYVDLTYPLIFVNILMLGKSLILLSEGGEHDAASAIVYLDLSR